MKPRILLCQLEFPGWYRRLNLSYSPDAFALGGAKAWSYAAGLGLEEGFIGNGIDFSTVTTPFWGDIGRVTGNRIFDQIWFEAVRHERISQEWLERLADLAPVRVGVLQESLCNNAFKLRKSEVFKRLKYCTHVLVGDEADVDLIESSLGLPVMWCPTFIPRRFIAADYSMSSAGDYATFNGTPYGDRINLLNTPALKDIMVYKKMPERFTPYPYLFNTLHICLWLYMKSGIKVNKWIYSFYMSSLRKLREKCFEIWLDSLRTGFAVVNLPSTYFAYPGRVLEAMAAGRPVISWRIENRPRLRALFRDLEEIVFFAGDKPDELAEKILLLREDAELSSKLTWQAMNLVKKYHTTEKRVAQIINWIESGEEPEFRDEGI